jgi:hypothetical protein
VAVVLFSGMKVPEEGRYFLHAYKKPAPFRGRLMNYFILKAVLPILEAIARLYRQIPFLHKASLHLLT